MQVFYPQECGNNNMNITFTWDKKQGIKWSTQLCEKLIEPTHLMWTKRNSFEHNRNLHRLIEVEDIHLKTAIINQYEKGIIGLKRSDRYLFNNSMLKL